MPNEPTPELSKHFIALCIKYPEFSFNVQALRRYRIKRDYDGHDANKQATGTVAFHNRVLDSAELGLDEEEAAIVHAALKQRQSVPLWGVDIVEKGQPTLSETADGRFTCGDCKKRYESMEGLTKHYNEKHKRAA